ncbi:hypothetical protein G9A89_000992 [Geosiphon pyriformis]|nr:hypothetical protein G9A89_000992 [Geosiphon pyriformis]
MSKEDEAIQNDTIDESKASTPHYEFFPQITSHQPSPPKYSSHVPTFKKYPYKWQEFIVIDLEYIEIFRRTDYGRHVIMARQFADIALLHRRGSRTLSICLDWMTHEMCIATNLVSIIHITLEKDIIVNMKYNEFVKKSPTGTRNPQRFNRNLKKDDEQGSLVGKTSEMYIACMFLTEIRATLFSSNGTFKELKGHLEKRFGKIRCIFHKNLGGLFELRSEDEWNHIKAEKGQTKGPFPRVDLFLEKSFL